MLSLKFLIFYAVRHFNDGARPKIFISQHLGLKSGYCAEKNCKELDEKRLSSSEYGKYKENTNKQKMIQFKRRKGIHMGQVSFKGINQYINFKAVYFKIWILRMRISGNIFNSGNTYSNEMFTVAFTYIELCEEILMNSL